MSAILYLGGRPRLTMKPLCFLRHSVRGAIGTHLPLALMLLGDIALCQFVLIKSAEGSPQPVSAQMATIEGTAFDPFYGEYTQFSYKDDVRIGDEWRVLLREVHQNTKEETALDSISEYRFSVPAGIYEIALPNPRQFIAYRRAHVRLLPGTHNKINVYPIHHTGVAETINGDVALPDPKLSYDDYHPDTENPEIDLLVQYGARTKGATHVKYRGPFLMLTFDTLTLSARTCVLDPRTLRTVAKNVLVDLGRTRMRADRAELNPHDRVIKVFLADGPQEYHF